jgi:hypothetical protein
VHVHTEFDADGTELIGLAAVVARHDDNVSGR